MPRIIDVVDHTNVGDEEFAWREPQGGSGDFRYGSRVIVGPSQAAVFVYRGAVQDMLRTGDHMLSTSNLPILSSLIGLATSGRTPFTADLYFINLKDMPQVGWGTSTPIVMETPGKGMGVVLLVTHGVIDISVDDAMLFVKQYAVGKPYLTVDNVKDRIQAMLLGAIAEIVGKSGVQSIPDANKILSELEGSMLEQVNEKFLAMGLRIKAFEANPFTAKNVPLEELRNYVSLDVWERVQRLQIAQTAAQNPGMGGALAGAGVGLGVGQQIGAALNPDQAAMQNQMMQNQVMMQQMMMDMMKKQGSGDQPAQAAPVSDNPQTKAEIQALLDNLDMKLAKGEISEAVYNKLVEKWQQRLNSM
jgi:membrane protease subunit (stomatin/prohibitin family)